MNTKREVFEITSENPKNFEENQVQKNIEEIEIEIEDETISQQTCEYGNSFDSSLGKKYEQREIDRRKIVQKLEESKKTIREINFSVIGYIFSFGLLLFFFPAFFPVGFVVVLVSMFMCCYSSLRWCWLSCKNVK